MKGISKTELKRYLQQQPPQCLIEDIADLFTKFSVVQDYYQAKLYPVDEEALLQKYRAVIQREFFPKRGFGKARRSVARKAISDYKKVSGSPLGMADLMLFFVEMGVSFTNEYGDIDEPFYASMERMYQKALHHIAKHDLLEYFEERCRQIMYHSANTGWGFHDTLSELFYQYYQP